MAARDHIARRSKYTDHMDYFPTPAYATRALFEYVIPEVKEAASELSIWDPACGGGHMCEVFHEMNFAHVVASDIKDWGYNPTKVARFQEAVKYQSADLIVTNPPYGDMADFVGHGLNAASEYLALLTRIQFLEGQRRYSSIFSARPPTHLAVFSDRIPFKQGKTVRKAPKMFTHCWVVWEKSSIGQGSKLMWIPPDAQDKLENIGADYDE